MVKKISDVEVVINTFENYNGNDMPNQSERIKFVLWSNILPSKDMCIFFSSTPVEHRNHISLKPFLRNTYRGIREKLMREAEQIICKLEAELAALKRKHAVAIPNYQVTNTMHKHKSRSFFGR